MSIRIAVDETLGCSIFEVEGEVSADDFIAAMDRQYSVPPPPHALWDYSRARLHNLSPADYTRIATAAKKHAPKRPGGRTAFVASRKFEQAAMKLLEAISEMVAVPIPLRLCETRKEAVAWLAGRGDGSSVAGQSPTTRL
jgi:hypothetical protein